MGLFADVRPASTVGRAAWATAGVLALGLVLVSVRGGPVAAQPVEPPQTMGPVASRGYVVRFEGVDSDLLSRLRDVSRLVADQSTPPAGIGGLRRRAQGDMERMTRLLQSRGYFEGAAAYQIDLHGITSASDTAAMIPGAEAIQTAAVDATPVPSAPPFGPLLVVVSVTPGPQFTLAKAAIAYADTDASTGDLPSALDGHGIAMGAPAIAAEILDAEKALVADLRRQGFPFAKRAGRKALANVEADTLSVTTHVQLGDKARFGELRVDGLERVTRGYIDRRMTFAPGEEYDVQKLTDMRTALVRSGLFSSVRFETADAVDAQGAVPIALTVVERPPRSVGGGLSFSSTEGFGLNTHWEHRNLLGEGQHLRLEMRLAEIEQEAEARFRVNGFRRADQTLQLGVQAGRESTDVYDRVGGTLSASVERPLSEKWTGSAGVLTDVARIDEVGEPDETSTLFGVPLTANYDGANSRIDPTRGYRLSFGATPYAGQFNDFLAFHLGEAEVRTYLPLDAREDFVFATRARVGSILGARTGDLPADKRFYAGGAGSVRGFEFQEISPVGADGTQEGGRSLIEFSNELRWRFYEDFGVVPFVDGGIVSDSPAPDFEDEFAWGAGLGFRYYTSFGPLGIDVAYPLTTPSDEEASLKIYVTLGQAF